MIKQVTHWKHIKIFWSIPSSNSVVLQVGFDSLP